MAGTHFSGPVVSTNGVTPGSLGSGVYAFALPLDYRPGTHAAGSGTIINEWRRVLPNRRSTLRDLVFAFPRGASAPQGGAFTVKLWSGTTSKGLASGSVRGATFESLAISSLGVTFPAGAHFQMSIHTVGATVAAGGGRPVAYFSHS